MSLALSPSRLSSKEHRYFLVFGALLVLFNLLMAWVPFFWDNVLNAKIATWYYEQESFQLFVPEKWDAGHPPFFNLYLAGLWKLFGKSLFISHLAMLPFVLGTLWQLLKLGKRYLPRHFLSLGLLFCVLEPTYLAQNSLISPDLVLVFAYLWGLNSILDGKRVNLLLAMLMMASVSFRGILMLPALTFSELMLTDSEGNIRPLARLKALFSMKNGLPAVWPYALTALAVLLWLYLHRQAVGWLFSPPPETYGDHRQMVGLGGMLRNTAILGWRFLDFGRVFLWIFASVGAFWMWRTRKRFSGEMRQLLLFFAVPTVLLALFFIPFSNPIGHRYFMVSYLFFSFILVLILAELKSRKTIRLIAASLFLALLGGHFWIYPAKVAQGWDASLAHLPWHQQQEEIRSVIKSKGWEGQVCASFPALAEKRYLNPGISPEENWPELQDKDDEKSQCRYVLLTPYSNGFSDAEIDEMKDWTLVLRINTGPIVSYLYQNPSP